MDLRPVHHLETQDIDKSLRMVIIDGVCSEVVVCLSSGVILVGAGLLMGASNFQLGLLAAFPTLCNLAQLLTILVMQIYPNRKVITVFAVFLAKMPLVVVGLLMWREVDFSFTTLLSFMFIHYLLSAIGGAGWNSWIKDLVPEERLGTYFSKRTGIMQLTNITVSIIVAALVDYYTNHAVMQLPKLYGIYFLIAGAIGAVGAFFLVQAKEPKQQMSGGHLGSLLLQPLKNKNFKNLLIFNAAWLLAINLAIPFFTVFMLKTLGLSMKIVILLTVFSQIASVLGLRLWGNLSDRYSNKSIIYLTAPIYICCILLWIFVGIYSRALPNLLLLLFLHIMTGISTGGINLALTNIGLKLAPKTDAIVYITVKNMVASFFTALGPILGGLLVDYFATRELQISISWKSPNLQTIAKLIYLHEWNFLFLIAALLAFISLRWLGKVEENGEVSPQLVKRIMKKRFRAGLKESLLVGNIITLHTQLKQIVKRKTNASDNAISDE
ncbi:MFS transporter [Sphingobacterium multivorum]|uniref:MFS transporter n=1 Tax=Sphingobacterium multivorum TaxID=28454 RepID=UPI002898D1DF|nr:MFS transporter [Sphingobacterium multivorum]